MAYAAAVVFWRDPFSDVYAQWKQHQLAGELSRDFASYRASLRSRSLNGAGLTNSGNAVGTTVNAAEIRKRARAYARGLVLGQPLGRIIIPKLGVNAVFVQGTRWAQDLSRGPGHYERTSLPGLGAVTAIAGHRTTFGAPFRHIDGIRLGDSVTLKLAYGTFSYRVYAHEIVKSSDWSVITPHGFDELVLSACHPLYSASHRWIVYARLVYVQPVRGPPYRVSDAARYSRSLSGDPDLDASVGSARGE
jgi:sortase A